jgi:sugar/nucleoside kinase (ribokinase family)
MDEVGEVDGWHPMTIYEPIPDRCVPEELPALRVILPEIDILSPNAAEALMILSMPVENVTRVMIEDACLRFLAMGVGKEGKGAVIIRSGELGAYVKQVGKEGLWVDAYWGADRPEKVVDVTGKGGFSNNTVAKVPTRCWKRVSRRFGWRFGSWKGSV